MGGFRHCDNLLFLKEHRDLNGVGECEGSKYVCMHLFSLSPMFFE